LTNKSKHDLIAFYQKGPAMASYHIFRAEKIDQIDPNRGIIIDIRTQMEYAEKHLNFNHAHIPLDELNPTDFMVHHGFDKDFSIYILCRSGKRATQAVEKFAVEGYLNVHIIEGGILASEDAGLEIHGCTSKSHFSLERQVRIAVGAIVTTGAFLGLFINPLFSIISLLAGCGLVFAGLTDYCGIALFLSKAPWNKMTINTKCTATSRSTYQSQN
jgi:rhodanese-related sulfurtransferase